MFKPHLDNSSLDTFNAPQATNNKAINPVKLTDNSIMLHTDRSAAALSFDQKQKEVDVEESDMD